MPSRVETTSLQDEDRRHDPIVVLIVDDDDGFTELIRRILEGKDDGIEVLTAGGGAAALEILQDRDVDCVVGDYAMPDMDGLDLLERVRRRHPGIPLIMMVGDGDEELASRAIEAGVDDVLRKETGSEPFDGLARRIRAHIRRREAASVYREAWQSATVGLTIHDPETGDFLDVNDRFCEMLGYSREELLGESIDVVAPEIDSYTANQARDLIRRTVEEGPQTFEWLDRTRDGDRIWVEVSLRPAWVGGKERVLASVRDITQRRIREDAIRSMYEVISDPELDFAETVDDLMSLGRRVLGTGFATLSRFEGEAYVFEHVQSPGGEIAPGEVVSIHDTLCEQAVIREKCLVVDDELEARSLNRDATLQLSCYVGAPVKVGDELHGTFCFYDVEARPEPFSDWEVTLVDLMSRWISGELERRRVREDLQRENERLEGFASMVSHDLRNPLVVAAGHAKMLQEEIENDSLDDLCDALDRMEELVEDTLAWARTGDAVEETDLVSLGDVAQDAWDVVESADAELRVEAGQSIQADRSRLQQLLENLFRNAVEHGGEDVTVTVGDLDRGFYVEDDGDGFPETGTEKLFEAGFTTAEEGTGFGLAIVEQVAQAHGWEIRAMDAEGGGARFEIHDVETVLEPGTD